MTTSRLLPFALMAAAIIAVLAALTAAGAVGNDNDEGSIVRESDDLSGDEVNDGGSALGACIVEDDPNYDPNTPCEDMVSDGDTADACLAGSEDCDDMPVPPPDDPLTDDVDSIGGGEDGRNLAVEAAYAALEGMGGPPASEVKVTGARPVEWSNACLGVEAPDIACAQVITPGWVIILSGAEGDYEFHTDLNGNAVFAPQQ